MRPVERGDMPVQDPFTRYKQAFDYLVARMGHYCGYCERYLPTSLAVEHIQSQKWHPHLELEWTNFLLACVNCNSTKKDKDVPLDAMLLPDRDNTFAAYKYSDDGHVDPADHLDHETRALAMKTLDLTGQNTRLPFPNDPNLRLIAIDRRNQRRQAWADALDSREDLRMNPSVEMRRRIIGQARYEGFFSIWMTVYQDDADMRSRLISVFLGTAEDCFAADTLPVTPRPANGLTGAGKA